MSFRGHGPAGRSWEAWQHSSHRARGETPRQCGPPSGTSNVCPFRRNADPGLQVLDCDLSRAFQTSSPLYLLIESPTDLLLSSCADFSQGHPHVLLSKKTKTKVARSPLTKRMAPLSIKQFGDAIHLSPHTRTGLTRLTEQCFN